MHIFTGQSGQSYYVILLDGPTMPFYWIVLLYHFTGQLYEVDAKNLIICNVLLHYDELKL